MTDPLYFLQDLAIILLSASIAGWLCRLVRLSPVVGYILAGLVISTPEITFPYVSDQERIGIIAQLGVVFLMFSIGLQFRLKRVQELGIRVVFSTALTAIIILTAVRYSADLIGLSGAAGIALAAVFMNSSSAIISKVIQESGIGHDRHGQLALGTTLLEDIVAVVMLAVLGSYIAIEGAGDGRGPLETIALLVAFVVLIFIAGMLLLPLLLKKIGGNTQSEALSIFVAGIVLMIALMSVYAGYSLALGAFLCGMIVAETKQKTFIERNFQGLKDIFLTLFFVTIGMMVDVKAIPQSLHWIILGIAGAIFGRSLAASFSLMIIGEHPRTAIRAALCVTPLGEFSFIIAGVAVAGGLFSEGFQVAVVGTVLGTSLISPLIANKGRELTQFVSEGKFPLMENWHLAYNDFWRGFKLNQPNGFLHKYLKKRILQIVIELILVTSVLIFADRIFEFVKQGIPQIETVPYADLFFWAALGLLIMIPLIAIWRNLSATAMILGEYIGNQINQNVLLINGITQVLRILFSILLVVWVWNVLPQELAREWVLLVIAVVAIPLLFFTYRNFIRIHSEFEWALDQHLNDEQDGSSRHLFDNWKDEAWDLNLKEFTLPDDTSCAGMTLRQLALRKSTGCSIVGIQRHGFPLSVVGPTTHLFPGDEILLLGNNDQIAAAITRIGQAEIQDEPGHRLENQILKSLRLPNGEEAKPMVLKELNWTREFGVQVVARMHDNRTETGLDADTLLHPGDLILLLGPSLQIDALAKKIHPSDGVV